MALKSHILMLAVALAGCAEQSVGSQPPTDGFYYPVSVAAVEQSPGKPMLYVASTNFDLRYNRGTVIAVDTSKLSDPPNGLIGAATDPTNGHAFIDNFAGSFAVRTTTSPLASNAVELYLPTRYNNRLYALSAVGGHLSCLPDSSSGQDCLSQGITLQSASDPNVRSVDPFGVALDGSTLYVTHLHPADNPPLTGQNRTSYLITLDTDALGKPPSFLDIGLAPAEAVLPTPSGVYLAGLGLSGTEAVLSDALRFVSHGASTITSTAITTSTHISEARGLALSSDKTRLFVTTRAPDGLLVVDISLDGISGAPRNKILGFTTLPLGPSDVLVIPRPGLRDLVAVSCTASNSVALFDDELGEATGLVQGIVEPFGLARSGIANNPAGARLYVASFGNHTVDVIDLSDVTRARTAVLVGHLGFGAHRPLGVDLPEGPK